MSLSIQEAMLAAGHSDMVSPSAELPGTTAISTPLVLGITEPHHGLLSEQFGIHNLLKEWTSKIFEWV